MSDRVRSGTQPRFSRTFPAALERVTPAEGPVLAHFAGGRAAPEDRLVEIAREYALRKRLSMRESEVFVRFVSAGQANKEIAADLGIAYPTVKLYWTRICRKLDCDNSVAALVTFMRETITALTEASRQVSSDTPSRLTGSDPPR